MKGGVGAVVVVLLVATVFYFTFASQTSGVEKGARIVLWHTYADKEKEVFLKIVESYRKMSGVEIDVQQQDYSSAVSKFIAHASAGNPPDILRVPNDRLGELASKGYLEPLNQFIYPGLLSHYYPEAIKAMEYNGELYALPASIDCLMLIYNKDLFDINGLEYPSENWSLEKVVDTAKKLTTADYFGFVFPAQISYWYFPFMLGFGGKIFDENGMPEVNSYEAVRAATYIVNLMKGEKVMPDTPVDELKMLTMFQQQKAAMIVCGPWKIPEIKDAGVNFGMCPLPYIGETGKRVSPLVGYKGYAISKDSKHKFEAFKLIAYLTGAEALVRFCIPTNTMPANKMALENSTLANLAVVKAVKEQFKYGTMFPTAPLMIVVGEKVSDALAKIVQGEDAQKAMDEAQALIMKEMG
ncbi:MAG: extracellular solute-binding protein [Thermoplasmata archaeon]|nr:extracellular solute-binding protein [Thermoplasmata archaeon]